MKIFAFLTGVRLRHAGLLFGSINKTEMSGPASLCRGSL